MVLCNQAEKSVCYTNIHARMSSAMSDESLQVESTVETVPAFPAALAVGTTLLERYTIIELVGQANGAHVYRVAEMRRCPTCGVENEGNVSRCGFCANALPAPRTFLLAARPTPMDGTLIPTSFTLSNVTFAFTRDDSVQALAPQPALKLAYSFASDAGLARGIKGESNEDSVLTFALNAQHSAGAPTLGLFIVADGVGGAEAGEVASQMTIQIVARELLAKLLAPSADDAALTDELVHEMIRSAIAQANMQLLEYAHAHNVPLGSTIALALTLDDHAYFANVGDSRAYLYRDETLEQITRDHSYVAQLVAKGEITEQETRTHPQRNLILRSLGDTTGFEMDVLPPDASMALQNGDQILLCSDGLWEMVHDQEIAAVLRDAPNAPEACAQLVSFANAAGGADNISVIVIRILT